jgi:hypothetical protein
MEKKRKKALRTQYKKEAEQARLDADVVVRAINALGSNCDCELLLNVTPDRFGYPSE